MTPYYSDDHVTLYHARWEDVPADLLRADVLVTDPPYGMAYVSNFSKYEPTDPITGDDSTESRDRLLAWWSPRPALVFGTWRVQRPVARHLLIWDKGDSPGMGDLALPWGPSFEEVYVIGDGFAGNRSPSVLRHPTLGAMDARRPDHPTPKPVPLMQALIEKCPPGTILDPFAGSGTTLVAAKSLNRKAIGVECVEAYCEVAANRLRQEVLGLSA